jgi:hypothetical protein
METSDFTARGVRCFHLTLTKVTYGSLYLGLGTTSGLGQNATLSALKIKKPRIASGLFL